jgi:23S rRNA (guanosine2251-2'-O)-methyltransferase
MSAESRKLKNDELERLSISNFKLAEKIPIVIVLDNVRSLNNVGSIFRTADAFRLEGIYLCGCTGTPPNKEITKTALGATETVNWKHFPSTREALTHLRSADYAIYSVEQTKNATMLNHFSVDSFQKTALIFGNEVYGVEQEIIDASDGCIEIPQLGFKHSLNISVSVGIVIWEFCRSKMKAPVN